MSKTIFLCLMQYLAFQALRQLYKDFTPDTISPGDGVSAVL